MGWRMTLVGWRTVLVGLGNGTGGKDDDTGGMKNGRLRVFPGAGRRWILPGWVGTSHGLPGAPQASPCCARHVPTHYAAESLS